MEPGLEGSLTLLIVFGGLALGLSFLCSIAEAVLLSTSPVYAESVRESKPVGAQLLIEQKENIDRPLAAILTLNTIAHTVGAVGVGAEAGALWGSVGLGLASSVMTVLILFLSEIIPKTIGAVYWRSLAVPTAFGIKYLIKILMPIIFLSEWVTRIVGRGKDANLVTRGEVAAVAELSAESGELRKIETRILKNLLNLNVLTAADIMTPRTVILAFPQTYTVRELLEKQGHLPVSRLPIYDGSIDKITGFVLKSDLLLAQANDQADLLLTELKRDLAAVPESASLSMMFEQFMQGRDHLALVVDEYGGTAGVVSMEDLVETLLGVEIVDEADEVEDMQRLARQHWENRAAALGFQIPRQEDPTRLQ